MKIGILDGVLKQPWETLFSRAAALGFDGVELGVSGDDYADSALWSAEGRKHLAELEQKSGAEIASVCLHTFWQFSFANPDESVRAKARDIATSAARFCAEIGAPVILVPVTPADGVEDAEGKQRWIEEMKRCAPVAEETGVTLALENVGRGYGKSADDLITLVDGVASPKVGVYYDCGNATYFKNNPADEIRRLGKRIAQVHTKEVEGTLMGEGKVDHQGSLQALKEIGYNGYIIFETNPTDNPDRAATANRAFLKQLLG